MFSFRSWFQSFFAHRSWGKEERAYIKKMADPTFKARCRINRAISRHNWVHDPSQSVDHVPFFRFEVFNHLEPAVWQYTLAGQEMYCEMRDGHGSAGDKYQQAKKRRSDIEREHGEALDKYLAPYLNRPRALCVSSEWHRWYAAEGLAKR